MLLGHPCPPTEGIDRNLMPGNIKQTTKFALKTTNYNAGMTSIDVFGFLDLNDTNQASKPNGTTLFTMTGRECLTTYLRFQDSSSFITKVHQQVPLGSISLVYPNTPEGKKLITGIAKNITAFTTGHLGDHNIASDFIHEFLSIFVDRQLVYKSPKCKWD